MNHLGPQGPATLITERIDILAEPPWHRSEFDADIRDRFKIILPTNTAHKSLKKSWAKAHKAKLATWGGDPSRLLIYTDGSLTTDEDGRFSGWGFAAYTQGTVITKLEKGATGSKAEVYDAEMEALARASEYINSLENQGRLNQLQNIHFFADNTGAGQRIFKGTPGKAQSCSSCFRRNILDALDRHPILHVTIEWVPGHHKIKGNDRADKLAKTGSRLEPPDPTWQSISYIGASWTKSLCETWADRWAQTPRNARSDYTRADHFPPQLSVTHRFTESSRVTFSRLVQARTGHAHIGSYYSRFVPTESTECPCGEQLQTREHILHECTLYDRYRHLLGDKDEDRAIDILMGTREGVSRLADFIEVTGAFAKDSFV